MDMTKINQYAYFYILSTCESSDPVMRDLDGMEFEYLSEVVSFAQELETYISKHHNEMYVMIWKENIDENGNHIDNECVDSIDLADLI